MIFELYRDHVRRVDVYTLQPRGVTATVTDGARRRAFDPAEPARRAVCGLVWLSMPVHDPQEVPR